MNKLYPKAVVGSPRVFSAPFCAFVLFITVALFLLTQDFSHSIRWQQEGLLTVDETIAWANQWEQSVLRRVVLFSFGGLGVVSLLRRRGNKLRINGRLAYLIIFFLLWVGLSVAWADDPATAFKRVLGFVLWAVGALAVAERFSIRQIMFIALLCCGLFLIAGVFAEISLGTFHPFQSEYRFCGTDDPNVGSWALGTLLLTAVGLTSAGDRRRGIFYTAAFAALAFLLLSKTRTSFAAVLLALGSYYYLILSRPRKGALMLGLIFVVCLSYLVLGDRLISGTRHGILLGRDETEATTLTGRIPIWNECISYVAKRPLLGYGYDCFWTPQHKAAISYNMESNLLGVSWAYNGYIDLALNLGVVGAAAYILVMGLAIKRSVFLFKTTRDPAFAFTCGLLLFYCLVMLTEGISSAPNITQFTVFALLAKLGFGKTLAYAPQ
jgi:exopolysaccharide production protein ExoQ